jgi:predicted nucleotidyltransferase
MQAHEGSATVRCQGEVHLAKRLNIRPERLAEFCRKHHIRRLALFGSALRDDFRADSDLDFLVEFDPAHRPGWDIVDIEEELSHLVGGRKVDLVNPKYLNRHLRDRILASAVVQYEQG